MKLIKLSAIILSLFLSSIVKAEIINTSHAIAMHGDPKYSSNFKHVDYVNPDVTT